MPYKLPNTKPRWHRLCLIWGLPILVWAVLLVWFLASSMGENKNESSAEPVAPLEQITPENAARVASEEVKVPEENVKPKPVPQKKNIPYDFTQATMGNINLPFCEASSAGIIVNPETRKVIWAKNPDKAVPIASMTKMMTLLLTEEAIAAGSIQLETPIRVTDAAAKIGGAQVWLDPKETFTLRELLKSVAIKSANDSAYLVAEFLGNGDVSSFIQKMNGRARQIGMLNSTFYDPHGLGDSQKRNNMSTVHDLVILGEYLLQYPDVMTWAGTKSDTFRNGKTELRNHNNLVLHGVPGVDGLKTGYTKAAGFCVTFSCVRDGKRLLGCVTGYKSAKERDAFCKALLNWAYSK